MILNVYAHFKKSQGTSKNVLEIIQDLSNVAGDKVNTQNQSHFHILATNMWEQKLKAIQRRKKKKHRSKNSGSRNRKKENGRFKA